MQWRFGIYMHPSAQLAGDIYPLAARQRVVFSAKSDTDRLSGLRGMRFWLPEAHTNLSRCTEYAPFARATGAKRTAFEA
eukprot:4071909-Pyramimonas_sp.AAC.1